PTRPSHAHHLPPFPTRRSSDLIGALGREIAPHPLAQLVRRARIGGRAQVDLGAAALAGRAGESVRQGGSPRQALEGDAAEIGRADRKSTRLNSSHVKISYAVFC